MQQLDLHDRTPTKRVVVLHTCTYILPQTVSDATDHRPPTKIHLEPSSASASKPDQNPNFTKLRVDCVIDHVFHTVAASAGDLAFLERRGDL